MSRRSRSSTHSSNASTPPVDLNNNSDYGPDEVRAWVDSASRNQRPHSLTPTRDPILAAARRHSAAGTSGITLSFFPCPFDTSIYRHSLHCQFSSRCFYSRW